ncbi:MAG: ATP-binding protein [Bacteroidales bacterium]|nr:ATP-binding protein [Bacteroidales bacterium]
MERVLNITSRIENLREVEKMVDEISTACSMSSEVYGNVLIATLEAANNAILHGNKLDENKDVNLEFTWDENRLELVVTDQGKGFNYKDIPDPTAPGNVEKVNGRGVFLMEKLSDDINFMENGSKVTLTFNL